MTSNPSHKGVDADNVDASALVEGAGQPGMVPPAVSLITLTEGAHGLNCAELSATSSGLGCLDVGSSDPESRSHRCLGDSVEVIVVRPRLGVAPEFSSGMMNAAPVATRLEFAGARYNSMALRA